MEEIVKSSSDISWDGMTVVILMNEDGYYTKNGVFDNGVWKTNIDLVWWIIMCGTYQIGT